MLAGDLASDGTSLYFGILGPQNTGEIDSAGMDGSGEAVLTTGIGGWDGKTSQNGTTDLFVVNGVLYFPGDDDSAPNPAPVVLTMPIGGGAPTTLFPEVGSTAVYNLETLYRVDASGAYLKYGALVLASSMNETALGVVPLGGGTPSMLQSATIANLPSTPLSDTGGGLTVVGGTITFVGLDSNSPNQVFLESVPAAGGPAPTQVGLLDPWSGVYLVGDASGMYIDQTIVQDTPGIYSLSPSGTPTLFVSAGGVSQLALDAENVYWIEGGITGGPGSVHAKAR